MHSRYMYLLKFSSYSISLNNKNKINILSIKKQNLNNNSINDNSINDNKEEKIKLIFKLHNVKPIKY